ncbi:MAG: DUF4136 domain-containing protein [Colwellia sp.]
MNTKFSLLVGFLSVFMVMGCTETVEAPQRESNTLAISSAKDSMITYPQGSLFSLSPKYVKETSLEPKQTQTVYGLYTKAIILDLKKNGFVYSPSSQIVDFYVNFGVALSQDFSEQEINEKFGISPGLSEKNNMKKGSLLISIEDAKAGIKVWRGIAQGFAHKKLTIEQRQERALIIVSSVMKQFYQTK